MLKWLSVAALTVTSAFCVVPAQALPEIYFYGGAVLVAKTAGCPSWLTVGNRWGFAYFFPMAGTANNNASTLVLDSNPGGDAFEKGGVFVTNQNAAVTATHIFTRAGQYPATVDVVSISPTNPTTTTRFVALRFQIGKFDDNASCTITVDGTGARVLN